MKKNTHSLSSLILTHYSKHLLHWGGCYSNGLWHINTQLFLCPLFTTTPLGEFHTIPWGERELGRSLVMWKLCTRTKVAPLTPFKPPIKSPKPFIHRHTHRTYRMGSHFSSPLPEVKKKNTVGNTLFVSTSCSTTHPPAPRGTFSLSLSQVLSRFLSHTRSLFRTLVRPLHPPQKVGPLYFSKKKENLTSWTWHLLLIVWFCLRYFCSLILSTDVANLCFVTFNLF